MRSLSWLVLFFVLSAAGYADGRDRISSADVEAVLAAVRSGDGTRIEALASRDVPDPWALADELLVRGEYDAAVAFAEAAPRQDTDRLPAYVRSRKGRPIHKELRALADASAGRLPEDEAQAAIEKLDALAAEGDAFERILADIRRANLLKEVRRNDEAAEANLAAGQIAERLGWLALGSRCFLASGMQARLDFNFDGMLTAWKRLITVERGRGKEKGLGKALLFVGNVYGQLGDYEMALRYFQEAEEAYGRIDDDNGIAWVLSSQAEALRRQGRHPAALVCLERALDLGREVGNRFRVGRVVQALGSVAQELGDLDAAERRFREALVIFQALESGDNVATCLGSLANVLVLRGQSADALPLYDEAMRNYEGAGEKHLYVVALDAKGSALRKMGRLDEALRLHRKALELARLVSDEFRECNALQNLAIVHLRKKDYAEAQDLIEQSIDLATKLGAAGFLVDGYEAAARLWLEQSKFARAFRAAERGMESARGSLVGLSQARAAMARGQLTKMHVVAIESAVAWKRPEAVFAAMENARAGALLEALENRDAIRAAAVPEALREQEDAAKRDAQAALLRYRKALTAGNLRDTRKRRRELERAQETVRAAVGRIQHAQKSAASVLYPEAASLEEVQDRLAEDEAFIIYSLLGERATALVVHPGAARIVDLGATASIQATAQLALDVEGAAAGVHLEKQRALLIGPLNLEKRIRRLHVSPDGVLGYVPFGALLPDRSVALVPSATTFQMLGEERVEPGRGVLALGDPDYGEAAGKGAQVAVRGGMRLTPLPETREEATRIGDVVLLGKQATPAGFLESVKKRPRWRAVHLACHGLIDAEHPMQSALALAFEEDGDNLLTSAEVFRHKIPADLAVLSACETGRGKIYRSEGIVGLTQAFMLAGAPRVIVSLWKVDDAATRALMIEFYRLWHPQEGKGLPPAEALAKAQAHVRATEKWKHPSYWAAWVLWGLAD